MVLPVLTRTQVRKVAADAKNARHHLSETVRGRAREDDGNYYWGQFLDGTAVTTQLGVYGTAAGVELLARQQGSVSVQLLCEAMGEASRTVPGFTVSDASLVHKVAAVVSAAGATEPGIGLNNGAVRRLLTLQLPGGGWCGYDAASDPNAVPERVETAAALLALAKVEAWIADPTKWSAAMDWLVEHLSSGNEVAESFALLTIRSYQGHVPSADWVRWGPAVRRAEARTEQTLRKSVAFRRLSHHYVARIGGEDQNKYMLYCGEILAALALLARPLTESVPVGGVLTSIVQQLVNDIETNGALVLDDRKSIVDQLWADRLLEAFVLRAEHSPGQLLSGVAQTIQSTHGWGRAFIILVLFVVTGCGAVVATTSKTGIAIAVGFVVSGLGLMALWSLLGPKGDD